MLHLLIVDDEWLDREGLRDQIMRMDLPREMVIHTAKSGAEALRLMQMQAVDILMTDIRMPQMTGLELVGRAMQQQPQLLTIFVSGYDDFAYAQQAIEMRAVWYLLKPVQDDQLQISLHRCIASLCPAQKPEQTLAAARTHEEKLCAHIDGYISAHLSSTITLIQIANEMHYTPNYLGRVFQETRGVGFSAYLQKMRLLEAERLLREQPMLRIREVSRRVGYTNAEAFSRAFYQEYGVSPLVFRNTVKA